MFIPAPFSPADLTFCIEPLVLQGHNHIAMNFTHLLACLSVSSLSLVTSCKQSAPNTESTDTSTSPEEYILYVEAQYRPGAIYTKTSQGGMENIQMTIQTRGQSINGLMSRKSQEIEIITIDNDTQHTIFYERKDAVTDQTLNGQKSPTTTEVEPLHKKTVIMTKNSEGLWNASLKSGQMTDEIQEALDQEAKSYNNPEYKYMYGTEPRKIGDTWKVDPSFIPTFTGDGAQNVTGSVSIKFDSVRKHNGLNCAVLNVDFDLQGNHKNGVQMKMRGTAEVLRSLDDHIDTGISLQGTITANGDIPQGESTIEMSGPFYMKGKADIKTP